MSAAPVLEYAAPAKEPWQTLPDDLAAREPPEARGLTRDGVRLMVSRGGGDLITHARFRHLPEYLQRGDVVVVNTSATINASLDAWREETGEWVELHLSTPVPEGKDSHWVVELREVSGDKALPLLNAHSGESLQLAGGGTVKLLEPYQAHRIDALAQVRLWIAELRVPGGVLAYAEEHGSPIRYSYVKERWPISLYMTMFATEPGSAEMPSAGRAFTQGVVDRLERNGIRIVPLVLHTGVASLESGEPPYPERYRVPAGTAEAVNLAHQEGHRVIAVGTTVVRVLETVAASNGRVGPDEGWTDLVISPERGLYAVDGMITGFHEPRSSHLAMLEALAGRGHIALAYQAALEGRYLWHEFGDLHLILP
ncbi:MAG TPA: S-adenosylmethionine:tRNA ribosyltransferase-isomerase [Propionibacteriaceae bacterium]|nr:S-adenosylmethionine:tRNA ribosyltransferase-isomerase [Propionibacteriaceae bacterium]